MRTVSKKVNSNGRLLQLAIVLMLMAVTCGTVPAWGRDAALPEWLPATYQDFPVRLTFDRAADLDELLRLVPLRGFHREQIAAVGPEGLVFEPRITAEEGEALARAGYKFDRLPDVEQDVRRTMESAWAAKAQVAGKDVLEVPLEYYPTHAQIGEMLAQLAVTYSAICDTFIWGHTVEGRELWGLRISSDIQNTTAEPEVRLSSSMHGDETLGIVLLLNLAQYLTEGYGQPGFEDVTGLVDFTEIHIMPLHNPDGYVAGRRSNANFVDLNRNFPEPAGSHPVQQIENIHFMNYGLAHNFVISKNGHGGALVVNYPWDWQFALAPDDAALINLSLEFSTYNLPMYNGPFDQGITNGAEWYVALGTLQDWSYEITGCVDLTIEYGNAKTPPTGQLATLWDDNRESLMHFIRASRYGVHGVVTDSVSGDPLDVTVTVAGNAKSVTTDPEHGDYYKLLPTGTFDLTFTADGYLSKTITGIGTTWGTETVLNVGLVSDPAGVPDIPAARLTIAAAPNPFNPRTVFTFDMPASGRATVEIFDLRGRKIHLLADAVYPAGTASVSWDGMTDSGRPATSGIYFTRVIAVGEKASTKVVLVR